MTYLRRYLAIIVLFAAPQWLYSQEPAEPIIRVTVDLVQVDAIVTDSRGHHVAGLQPEDFEVLEDGKVQRVTHFSYVDGSKVVSRKATGFSSAFVPAEPLRSEQVRRTLVMIADDLGLAASDIVDVRKAMKRFVDSEMQSGDLVSIMTTSGGMGALEQLTNDKRQLYAAIERIHWIAGRSAVTWYDPVRVTPDKASAVEAQISRRLAAPRGQFFTAGSMSAVAFAIRGLRDIPGRKAIAFFSDGFSERPDLLVELANRASVVVYTFDPRGLASFALSAVDYCRGCNAQAYEARRKALFANTQRGMELLARGTGGTFFHDDNGLAEGIIAAINDMSSYYLLGYQPDRSSFNKVHGSAPFHKISVRTVPRGLTVRSRNGFVGIADEPATAQEKPSAAATALRDALFSPFQANEIPVQLSAFYSAAEQKKGARKILLRAMLAIDPHQIQFTDRANGRKELKLDALAVIYGANNKLVKSDTETFTGGVEAAQFESLASGLLWGMNLEIATPGPYQLRVALRDAASGRIGSATAFVEIPDFNKPAPSLSSILLTDADAKRNDELTRAGVIGAGTPVVRAFGIGATVTYDCAVFGSLVDPKMQVRLFSGPEQIYTGQPIPLSDAARAAGQIKLPPTLPAGRYALELTVYDAKQKAAQWIDFRIVR